MENELLQQIIVRLDKIESNITEMKAELQEVKAEQREMKAEQQEMKAEQQEMKAEQQEMKAEQQEMKRSLQQQIDDMRESQMLSEQRMTKQLGAIMDSQAVIMDIARDTQKILHMLQASQEKYDSEKVAVDVTLIDHEKRIVRLERQAV